MESEFENNILLRYYAAVEMFQRVESIFYTKIPPSNNQVIQELNKCVQEIETIISLEENTDLNFMSLHQIQQQLFVLIKLLESRAQELSNAVTPALPSSKPNESAIKENKPKKRKLTQEPITDLKHLRQIPKIAGLADVIGLSDAKRTLKTLFILSKTQPQIFLNRKLANTVLLYGAPGTGKTRLVHAIAAEADAELYCVTAADFLSPYVGQTEKSLKDLFGYFKKPNSVLSILFIDEIDGICRKRSIKEQEHTRRLKTELMCQLSEIVECKQVLVVAATNCPFDLDTAILRRFQKRIYVPFPNDNDRFELFRYLLRNESFETDFGNWLPLITATQGYSGSDINDLVQFALNIPVEELLDAKVWKERFDGYLEPVSPNDDISNVICSNLADLPPNSVKQRGLCMRDLMHAVGYVKKTVSDVEVQQFEKFNA